MGVTELMTEWANQPDERCKKCGVGGKGVPWGTSETLNCMNEPMTYTVKCGFCGAIIWHKFSKESENQDEMPRL